MDLEKTTIVAIYAFDILLLPAVGWAVWMYWTMRKLVETLGEAQVRNDRFSEVIERNTKAIEAMTGAMTALKHYVKWLSEQTTGNPPPPPLDGRANID